jgi:hypothetical protein
MIFFVGYVRVVIVAKPYYETHANPTYRYIGCSVDRPGIC